MEGDAAGESAIFLLLPEIIVSLAMLRYVVDAVPRTLLMTAG